MRVLKISLDNEPPPPPTSKGFGVPELFGAFCVGVLFTMLTVFDTESGLDLQRRTLLEKADSRLIEACLAKAGLTRMSSNEGEFCLDRDGRRVRVFNVRPLPPPAGTLPSPASPPIPPPLGPKPPPIPVPTEIRRTDEFPAHPPA